MNYSSLESSHWDRSNGNKIAFLTLIDNELDLSERTCNISWFSDGKRIWHSLLESSRQGSSNGSKIAFLASIDDELDISK